MANDTEYNQPKVIGGVEQFDQLVSRQDGTEFDEIDWRARIRPKKGGERWAYGLVDPETPLKTITD